MNLTAFEKRLARLAGRIAPPVAAPSALDLFTQAVGEPDPWQRRVLASTADRLLLNAARQTGKSSVAAALGLSAALSPASLVLVLSPGERQSKLLFKKIVHLYRRLGETIPAEVENRLSLELSNSSEIHALPGSEATVRGFSAVDVLLVDEASRVADELFHAVTPMLAVSGGQLVAMSTPWGRRGWWFEAWERGGGDWERVEVPAATCDRIPPAFLAEQRRTLPPLAFASEYECRFVENEDSFFRESDVAAAFVAGRPLFAEEGTTDDVDAA